jgi:hypothetical protein
MGAPRYHPDLVSGALDKPRPGQQGRPDLPAVRQRMQEMDQAEAPDAGQVLLEIDRTKRGEGPEKLRIALKEYEGHPYLDLRIWWQRQGQWLPGKKGVTLRARDLADVQRVLAEAAKRMGVSQ